MSFNATTEQDEDKIIINVGGKRHESYLSTLRNIPDTRLSWIAESIMNKQSEDPRNEIFFDRHPDIFGIILNYYRTGQLHAPRDCCGPLFQAELCFWGIEEKEMEACCWPNYTQHRDAEKNLKDFVGPEFEDEEDGDMDNSKELENPYYTHANVSTTMWGKYQPRIWAVLDNTSFSSRNAKLFAMLSLSMIVLSIVLMCAASLPRIRRDPAMVQPFKYAENVFCAWFTLEFTIRIIFCPSKKEFFKQVMTWIDFISLVPYFFKIAMGTDTVLDFLRSMRLIRLFRAFRFFRFTSGLQIIVQSLKASFRELLLLVIILLIPVVLFSSFVYEMEKEKNVEFTSIPQSFWWAVITMTTVGYGDMAPRSIMGQIFGSICAICGVLILGLPVSVIGNNFSTYYEHAQARLNLPKKKRRLIMGDVNRLAFLQGQSNSSGGRDRESVDVDIDAGAENELDADEREFTKNYRRYHRRSRNTIFARGNVYIGQTRQKSTQLPATRENSTEENSDGNIKDGITESGEDSSHDGEETVVPNNFTLVSSSHESEEIIEETNKSWNNVLSGYSDGALRDERRNSRRSRRSSSTRSKSWVELKSPEVAQPTSPRPGSSKSFKTRVTPTLGESKQRVGSPRSLRCNTPFLLPSLSTTHLKAPEDSNDFPKRPRVGFGEDILKGNGAVDYGKRKGRTKSREKALQNGDL